MLRFLPLALFVLIVVTSLTGFYLGDRDKLPSSLIDRPFPNFEAVDLLDAAKSISKQDLLGKPVLVNVWATWCPTCLSEHQSLMDIKRKTDLLMVGINYKDDSEKAISWLDQQGNPFHLNIVDQKGELGIDLGVYGAPESFLLDDRGIIRHKRIGDINERVWKREFEPLLAQLSSTYDERLNGTR